jgi:hypothetical protein
LRPPVMTYFILYAQKGGVLRKSGHGQKSAYYLLQGDTGYERIFDSAHIGEINAAQGGQLRIRRHFSYWENGMKHGNTTSLFIPDFASP